MEEFLFKRKTGYCEHFATAMVLMLRTLGIPARMVSGFLPTEWNDYGNYFTIRQRDAHTWVEAYFPGSGWITFDPTPAVGVSGTRLFSAFANYMDTLRLKWDRYIIQYSFRDQATVVKTLNENATKARMKTQQFFAKLLSIYYSLKAFVNQKGIFLFMLPLLLILLTVAVFIFFYKTKKRISQGETPQEKLIKNSKKALPLYLNMLAILKEHGFVRETHQTPHEFLRTIRLQESPLTPTATEITHLYCSIRYGHGPFSSQTKSQFSELLKHLKTQSSRLKQETSIQKSGLVGNPK